MFGKTVKGKVSYMWDLRDPWVHPGSATHWDVLAHSTRPSALMTSQFYRDADIENRLVGTVGEGEGGTN